MKRLAKYLGVSSIIVVVFCVWFVMAWVFQLGWNYAVVEALSVARPIGYWHAFVFMFFVGFFVASSKG